MAVSFAKIPFETVFAYFFQLSSSLMRLVNGHQTLSPRESELWADDCLKLKWAQFQGSLESWSLCCAFVTVMQTAEPRERDDATAILRVWAISRSPLL